MPVIDQCITTLWLAAVCALPNRQKKKTDRPYVAMCIYYLVKVGNGSPNKRHAVWHALYHIYAAQNVAEEIGIGEKIGREEKPHAHQVKQESGN